MLPKSLGEIKSNTTWVVYSDTGLPQEKNLRLTYCLKKQKKNKAKSHQKEGNNKDQRRHKQRLKNNRKKSMKPGLVF